MGTMTRAQFSKLLQNGLNTVFGLEYKQHPEEWRACFDTESSKKAFEEDQLVTGFGAASVKAEGAGVKFDDAHQGWTSRYTHETIALAFAITQEAIEDNLYMSMGSKYAKALARSMQHTKEIKGADIFNRAITAGYEGGDGKTLLATDHPLVNGATASNMLSTAADLSESALEDLLILMRKSTDDRGIPLALKAKGLIIPPDLEYVAHRILRTKLRPGTADNDANAIRDKSIFNSDPSVVTRLVSPTNWFVKTDINDGLKHFERVALKRSMETDFNTGDYRYAVRSRYSFGHTDWRGVFGSAS